MSAEVQDLAVRYGAAWAAQDLDAIMALHTEDTVFHLHGDVAPAVGSAAAREAFATAAGVTWIVVKLSPPKSGGSTPPAS